jgi:8-oxo-dGTP diphosphatase
VCKRHKGVAVVIQNNKGEVLLLQRGAAARTEVGRWENPGGEIEEGEDPVDAAIREVREELGVEVEIMRLLYSDEFPPDSNDVIWTAGLFEGRIQGQPEIKEPRKCSALGWFSRDQLGTIPLASFTRSDFSRLGWLKDQSEDNTISANSLTAVVKSHFRHFIQKSITDPPPHPAKQFQ